MANTRVVLTGDIPSRGELVARREPGSGSRTATTERRSRRETPTSQRRRRRRGAAAMWRARDGAWHDYFENGRFYYYRERP